MNQNTSRFLRSYDNQIYTSDLHREDVLIPPFTFDGPLAESSSGIWYPPYDVVLENWYVTTRYVSVPVVGDTDRIPSIIGLSIGDDQLHKLVDSEGTPDVSRPRAKLELGTGATWVQGDLTGSTGKLLLTKQQFVRVDIIQAGSHENLTVQVRARRG